MIKLVKRNGQFFLSAGELFHLVHEIKAVNYLAGGNKNTELVFRDSSSLNLLYLYNLLSRVGGIYCQWKNDYRKEFSDELIVELNVPWSNEEEILIKE